MLFIVVVCMYVCISHGSLPIAPTHRCSHSWSSYCALLALNDAFWPAASRGAWAEDEEDEERKGFSAPANGPWLSMQEVWSVGSCFCVCVGVLVGDGLVLEWVLRWLAVSQCRCNGLWSDVVVVVWRRVVP